MAPDDSWASAIDFAVCLHCAGVRTPGTPGTSGTSTRRLRLAEVQRHTLPDQRVEQRLGRCGHLTLVLHRLEDLVDVIQVGCVLVECDDVCAPPECLERMPASTAA